VPEALLAVVGALLVLLVLVDAAITTLAAGQGGGPLTGRVGNLVWRVLRGLGSGPTSRALSYAGAGVLLVTVLVWVALHWAGWTLVFLSSEQAVVNGTTREPADLAARVYYAGFTVFTLGLGDYQPGGALWQVLTALATFLGLFVATLSITYLISVVSAAVDRRTLARSISLSGGTGSDIVLLHWTGTELSSTLPSLLVSLSDEILQVTQQHLAYPVLHHFHAGTAASSAPRALAALDDALLLLSAGLVPRARPPHDVLVRTRRALEHYATTVAETSGDAGSTPPLPALSRLREAGIPTLGDDEFATAARDHRARRQRVAQLVAADADRWPA
jgi:hypothetical protein